jgi:hypothetical protein
MELQLDAIEMQASANCFLKREDALDVLILAPDVVVVVDAVEAVAAGGLLERECENAETGFADAPTG